MMTSQPSIGLVIADTENYSLARNAIENSLRHFDVKEVLVFSDNRALAAGFRHIPIEKIRDIDQYNQLILKELPRHLTCDYYLVIQYDGFIINGANFSADFLAWDYIGAVWPQHPFHRVGNGGFSLRSRRLIEAAAQLGEFLSPKEPEDEFICRTLRPLLEKKFGIAFAREEVASRFSFETIGQPINTFGFHGFHNLPLIYGSNIEYLLRQLPLATIRRRLSELMKGADLLPPQQRADFDRVLASIIEPVGT